MTVHEQLTDFPHLQTRIQDNLILDTDTPMLTVVDGFSMVAARLRVGNERAGLHILAGNITLGVALDTDVSPSFVQLHFSRPARKDETAILPSDNPNLYSYFAKRYFPVDADKKDVAVAASEGGNRIYDAIDLKRTLCQGKLSFELPLILAKGELEYILREDAPSYMHGCANALLQFANVMAHYLPNKGLAEGV